MPTYNKLVRDNIPNIIKSSGKNFRCKQLNEHEFKKELEKKIYEEILEFQEAKTDEHSLEELADVLEILHSLALIQGADFDKVEKIRKKKYEERGGFRDKIFLIDVNDD